MIKKCTECGVEIPQARLSILPYAKTCVNHSTAEKYGMRTIAYGTNADNAQQEFEIIKDAKLAQKLEEYASNSMRIVEVED